MATIRFIVWTGLCLGLGVAMATVDVGRGTVVHHLGALWETHGTKLKSGVEDALGEKPAAGRKARPSTRAEPSPTGPSEQHSRDERNAVDALIRRSSGT